MSVLDIFGNILGWCPKFKGTPEQLRVGEEKYRGSTALFAAFLLTGLSMIALYTAFFTRVQAEGLMADNGVRTMFSFLLTGGILLSTSPEPSGRSAASLFPSLTGMT